MYAIFGEYDSVSPVSNRNNWLRRNNLEPGAGVITDPFDLPARYDNPIQYLIYPNTPAYPGSKFETTTWFDANGIPLFADTTADGREHNNTAPDARRIWTEWFSRWRRDDNGNRVYARLTPPQSLTVQAMPNVLNLRARAGLVTVVINAPADADLRTWGITGLTAAGAPAVSTAYTGNGRSMVVTFNRAQLDALPSGDNVTFTISGLFNRDGFQWPFSLDAVVRVMR